jgi:hypothetical protein
MRQVAQLSSSEADETTIALQPGEAAEAAEAGEAGEAGEAPWLVHHGM